MKPMWKTTFYGLSCFVLGILADALYHFFYGFLATFFGFMIGFTSSWVSKWISEK